MIGHLTLTRNNGDVIYQQTFDIREAEGVSGLDVNFHDPAPLIDEDNTFVLDRLTVKARTRPIPR